MTGSCLHWRRSDEPWPAAPTNAAPGSRDPAGSGGPAQAPGHSPRAQTRRRPRQGCSQAWGRWQSGNPNLAMRFSY
eukprot:gene14780-biopygen17126